MIAPIRRSATAAATTCVLVLAAAACANPDNDESAGSGDGDGSAATETRSIEDTFTGTVEDVPVEPQRVVALWRTGSILADLGVKPVGALEGEFLDTELDPETYSEYADIETVGTFEGVDPDDVIALEPDLIVGMDNGGLGIDYEELGEIAPTVILKIAEPTDVWANYPEVADVVGASTTYEEQQADLDDALADVAAEHGAEMGQTEATSIGASEGTLWVDTSKSLAYERIDAAGFGYNPDYTDDPERYLAELSMENLADLSDQDLIFYEVSIDGTPLPDTQKVLDSASFTRLPAARAGHVYPLTSGIIYTFAGAQQQVDDLRAAAEDYSG